jgi:dephospho-CoA kinase
MIIGVTGNIGSGKSTFSKILATMLEWKYVDMDVLAKTRGFEYRKDIEKICKGFGFDKNEMNYLEFIKKHFFSNTALEKAISEFIKPKLFVSDTMHTVLESALLFEEGFNDICDCIIVVTVPDHTRISRLEAFRRMTHAAIQQRLIKQIPEQNYLDKANYVVYNDGDEYALLTNAETIMKDILTSYGNRQ